VLPQAPVGGPVSSFAAVVSAAVVGSVASVVVVDAVVVDAVVAVAVVPDVGPVLASTVESPDDPSPSPPADGHAQSGTADSEPTRGMRWWVMGSPDCGVHADGHRQRCASGFR